MVTRRGFLAAGAAFGIGGLAFGRSRARQIAAGAKIRVALIGCGGRLQQLVEPIMAERIVALVDPDPRMRAATRERMVQVGGRDALAGVREFFDYRELYAKMGDALDAVFIATPNHHHALAAVLAMRRGIHVFVEKPMASTVAEAQLMGRVAKETGVVTQVGNFGHSTKAMRVCVESIRKGLIGEIRDVWCYDDRLNSMMHRPPAAPPPAGMDWDAWCGPAPVCDYYAPTADHQGLHPHDWHSWIGYGNGSIGNLGMHIMDVAFWALGLKDPDRVTCHEAKFALEGAWAYRDAFEFHFPATREHGELSLHWWDGLNDGVPYTRQYVNKLGIPFRREHLNIPPRVIEEEKRWGFEKDPFYKNGVLFVGTKANLWFTHHGGYRFMPSADRKSVV